MTTTTDDAEGPSSGPAARAPAAPAPAVHPAAPPVLAEIVDASQTPGTLRGAGAICEEAAAEGALTGSAARGPAMRRRGMVVAVVLATLAAAVFGTLWAQAASSGSLALARDRDAVLADARQAAVNLNTLDYRNVDAGLDRWEQSSTGQVLTEFQQNRDQYAKLVRESRRATVATVPAAAVTELDEHAGVARVLVAVDVTVTPEGQAPAVTRQRLQVEMTRTPSGWKVSLLSPVRAPTTTAGG